MSSPIQEQKIVSALIPDCLTIIFRCLTTNKDLHSCLLVNKFWANVVVPILWEAPFRNTYDFIPSCKIIPTYIACLPDESKKILSKEYNGKYKQRLTNTPLFNYPSFLTEIQYDELCNAIERSEGSCYAEKVVIEICKMISVRSTTLRRFSICNKFINQFLNNKSILLLRLPGSDNLFRNLKNFECGHQWSTQKISLLEAMAEQCHKITRLAVKVWREDEANVLAKLVREQKSLKSFVLLNSNHYASTLLKALISQRDTLTSIEFKDMNNCDLINAQVINVLTQCTNITTLNFRNCEEIDCPIFLPLGSAYSQLTSFHYSCGNLKSENVKVPAILLSTLFKSNGNTLEHISLSWNRPHSDVDVSQIIIIIAQHCHKLIDLEIPVTTTEEITLILGSCDQLKNLIIHIMGQFDVGTVLHHFIKHQHPSLVNLKFITLPYAIVFLDFDKVTDFIEYSITSEHSFKELSIDSPLCLYYSIVSEEEFQKLQQIYPDNFKFFYTEWSHYISILIKFNFHK
ncbi:hypothetical protein C1645_826092 [Glomus cerebriforme]|uniref:F-box domain-containing protein n=1 Tax=Glomus cerebriforme TaxID=658196 RepID=A0A397SUM7_9GLOM|nr:hypothetical protein C1645_826092 [Glomus cerebriforme]